MVNFEPEIIFEDYNILVLNKPAGLAVHADGRTTEPTLADWILEKYPELKEVGESIVLGEKRMGIEEIYLGDSAPEVKTIIPRPGIIHRLDRDTSGVMVIAKNQKTFELLKQQFQNRKVEKKYLALVWGNFAEDEGMIDRPIGKSAKDFRQKSAARGARGTLRPAITHWRVLERFSRYGISNNTIMTGEGSFTLLEVTPKTGRTHQIRVHMKAINHPIVCDKLYAPNKPCPVGSLTRQALHAASLTISLGSSTAKLDQKMFEAPLPDDFQKTLDEIRRM